MSEFLAEWLQAPHVHQHSFINYTDLELTMCQACVQDRLGWQPNLKPKAAGSESRIEGEQSYVQGSG